jgi:hypothetical protein
MRECPSLPPQLRPRNAEAINNEASCVCLVSISDIKPFETVLWKAQAAMKTGQQS